MPEDRASLVAELKQNHSPEYKLLCLLQPALFKSSQTLRLHLIIIASMKPPWPSPCNEPSSQGMFAHSEYISQKYSFIFYQDFVP